MTRFTTFAAAVAMVFAVATQSQATNYSQDFEGLGDGDPVSNVAGWSGNMSGAAPGVLGGNRGVVMATGGTSADFGVANLDIAGQSLQPQANDPWTARVDVYIYSGDGNQYTSGHGTRSGDNRLFELSWNTSAEWNFRIWDPAGGGPIFDTTGGTGKDGASPSLRKSRTNGARMR